MASLCGLRYCVTFSPKDVTAQRDLLGLRSQKCWLRWTTTAKHFSLNSFLMKSSSHFDEGWRKYNRVVMDEKWKWLQFLILIPLSILNMASEMGWGGLPYMVPSRTAMHYLMHAHSIIPEEEIPAGAHYRARQDMLDNVSTIFSCSIVFSFSTYSLQ